MNISSDSRENKQQSMWRRQVYLQMTRALAPLEQSVDSTERDWHLLYERQQNSMDTRGQIVNSVIGTK